MATSATDVQSTIRSRAEAAGVPPRTVGHWMDRGSLSQDASVDDIRAYAEAHWRPKGSRRPKVRRGSTPAEIREAIDRGELRVWTPTDPEERARYGLAPLEAA